MGMIFGKYGLYVTFKDGSKGFVMKIKDDFLMTTSTFQNAEKFMSENSAIEYGRRHDILNTFNENMSKVDEIYLYSDGKLFRM